MTIKEVYEHIRDLRGEFNDFKNNEFKHLRNKTDWIFYTLITFLIGVIALLIKGSL